jgi:hypothetical protein
MDCPDTCRLDVKVEDGRVVELDGVREDPFTDGFICAKVRGFAGMYGRDPAPAGASGPRGQGRFRRLVGRALVWPPASCAMAERSSRSSCLPLRRLQRHAEPRQRRARLFRRLGANRLLRTYCAAATAIAAQAMSDACRGWPWRTTSTPG